MRTTYRTPLSSLSPLYYLSAAAFFMGHVMRSGKILPIENEGELAALYSWLFLHFAAKGSGIWSIDALRRSREEAPRP